MLKNARLNGSKNKTNRNINIPYSIGVGMKQKNTVESLSQFVKRSQAESNETIERLTGFLKTQRFDGLGFADFGAKIALEEGKLNVLQHVAWLIEHEAAQKEDQND